MGFALLKETLISFGLRFFRIFFPPFYDNQIITPHYTSDGHLRPINHLYLLQMLNFYYLQNILLNKTFDIDKFASNETIQSLNFLLREPGTR